jgi:signal transduction histidine kinase
MLVALLSFTSHAVLSVVCAATMLLALWQGVRHRRNQRLALAMFIFGCFGGAGVIFRFQELLDLSPALVIYFANSCYAIGIIALIDFLLEYVGVAVTLRRRMRAIGLLLVVVFSVLMWGGFAFTNAVKTEWITVSYEVTPIGALTILAALSYQLIGIVLIRRTHARHSRILWLVLAVLPLEALVSVIPGLQGLTWDSTALIFVVLVVSQLVIRDQILEPNLILNVQLARANAELTRSNKRKTEFLAVISHELRTPLGAIISYTEMMLLQAYGPLTERQMERLRQIEHKGHYLLDVIGNVLDLSKIEAGQLRLNIAPMALHERILPIAKALLPNAQKRGGITLVCAISPELPRVCADPAQFDKLMRSLIGSALAQLQFGTLTISAEQEKDTMAVTISHNGAGYAPSQIAHLFDPTHANLPNENTRLELAIAAQLVRLHGGTLTVSSDGVLGHGASFRFNLPIYRPAELLIPAPPAIEPIASAVVS